MEPRTVRLTIDEANLLCAILRDFSSAQWAHARRTKSAAIRESCETRGRQASDLDAIVVRRLYADPPLTA